MRVEVVMGVVWLRGMVLPRGLVIIQGPVVLRQVAVLAGVIRLPGVVLLRRVYRAILTYQLYTLGEQREQLGGRVGGWSSEF